MGYTHYWKFRKGVGNGEYAACAPKDIMNGTELFKNSVALFRECLDYMGGKTRYPNWGKNAYSEEVTMKLCGGNGEGEPEILDDLICFNGCRATDNACETCYIDLNEVGDDYCKTSREPYDTAVWVCLLCFKYYFGENIKLTSDGDDKEHGYAEEVFNAVVESI